MLYAFTRRTTVRPGEWFVVLGAGGGVGLACTDLASALGAKVVACASSEEKLGLATAAGAVATIAYEDVDLKTAIRDITDGGADAVVDPIGGPKAESALRALRWEGRYLVIGFAAGDIPRFPLNQVLLNSRTLIGIELGGWVPARTGRLPRPHRRADRPRRRRHDPPRGTVRPPARRRPRRAGRDAVPRPQRQGRADALSGPTGSVRRA